MAVEWTKQHKYRAISAIRRGGAAWDAVIADLAARQHAVVAAWQLLGVGMTRRQIAHRVARGSLHRVHDGVYAVGQPRIGAGGYRMAAVLACGPLAVLSHRSALALGGILLDARTVIDVTAPGRRGRSITGIRAHACSLDPSDIDEADGIPCASVARALLDVAGSERPALLRVAVRQAERLGLLDLGALEATIARVSRPRGVRALRR